MNKHVETVCKIGQEKSCCRYLTMGPNGFDCEKNSSLKATIDHRVKMGMFVSQGDNWEGKDNKYLNS